MTAELPDREACIRGAGSALAAALAELDATPPREAAERAHRPGGPSVDELERRIRARRGESTSWRSTTRARARPGSWC